MFGLAALRIGYLAGSLEVVDIIRRTCVVYSVNALAQAAALATLVDADEHISKTRAMLREAREYLTQELTRYNIPYIAGEGSYVIIRLPMSDTLIYRKLMRLGYMVRTMTGFRFPNHIRVTLQPLPVMEGFIKALLEVLKK
jgi:histidinol-phosphate aminotransferase